MKLTSRSYKNESNDFDKMLHFIIEENSRKQDFFVWSIGRLIDWKYGLWNAKKYVPSFFSKNAQLWFDYFGELMGFAISESGDNMFYIFTNDRYPFLYEEILNWVKLNWSNRDGQLYTEVVENQDFEIKVLENNNFCSKGVCEVTRAFNCTKALDKAIDLPENFRYSNMKENFDQIGHMKMKLNAFRNRDTLSEIDILTYDYVQESPIYKPEFDFYIMNENGDHVCGCEALIDYANKSAEIERVCTHSQFRQKGFAKRLLIKCMKELSKHGIERAYITGMSEIAISLYGKLGHENEVRRFYYELAQ
jgi:GNAT superfamily N-acetyltransferase